MSQGMLHSNCPRCGKLIGSGTMGTVLPLCQCDWHRPILDHAAGMPSPAQIRCVELEQENAKLREQLAAAEAECNEQARLNGMGAERELSLMAKLEAAEANLKAASEQEPVAYAGCYPAIFPADMTDDIFRANSLPLYAAPIPPADVQEYDEKDSLIQQQDIALEQKAKRIAELERKLAEQQATVKNFFGMYARELPDVGEELNTLLAQAREEGRKEALPDGWVASILKNTGEK